MLLELEMIIGRGESEGDCENALLSVRPLAGHYEVFCEFLFSILLSLLNGMLEL